MASLTPEQMAKSGSEFGEQSALFCWANLAATRQEFPDLFNAETGRCKLYATNQNFTDAVKGARARQIGIQSGVTDIFLPVPRHGVHGLFIELKIDPKHPENQRTGKTGKGIKAKTGSLSDHQISFGRQVQADGFGWVCCEGWREAVGVIRQYMAPVG